MIPLALSLFRRVASLRTRLVLVWLWWRHTYTFNVAHKPLCGRFKDNVLRFGRVHVCRSCTLLYASAAATVIVLVSVELPETALVPFFYGLFVAVLLLSYPPLYERFPRPAKDAVRCATGSVMALMVAFFTGGHYWLGLLNVALFVAGYRFCLNEYKRWKLRACDGCSDLGRGEICRGYRSQAHGIRAYEAAAEEYVIREVRFQKSGGAQI